MKKLLRSARGFTLAEMLVVLVLVAVVGALSSTVIMSARRSTEVSVRASRCKAVSEILDAELRGVLYYAEDISEDGSDDGSLRFVSGKFSGWEMSLVCSGGRIYMSVDCPDGQQMRPIASDTAYSGFEVGDFSLAFDGRCFDYSFSLSDGSVSDTFGETVIPLNA